MLKLKKKSGIYQFKCSQTGRLYIGSAVCLYGRYHTHLSELKGGTHSNKHLQNIFNKYGSDSLVFSVIEFCDKASLINREQFYIDLLQPEINICKTAGNTLGVKHTPETRLHLSKIKKGLDISYLKGTNHTPEARKKISDKAKARGVHPNCLLACIKANTGLKQSKEIRDKIALLQRKITPQQANEIKKKSLAGVFQKEIAKDYHVSQRLIVRVLHGIGIYGSSDYINQNISI